MITRICRACGEQSFQTSKLYPWVCHGKSNTQKYPDTCGKDKAKLINKAEVGSMINVNGKLGRLIQKNAYRYFTVKFENYTKSFLYVDVANGDIKVKVEHNGQFIPMQQLYSYC